MLTIKVQTVKLAAEKYMEDHLSKGESLTEGEGHFESKAAEAIIETPVETSVGIASSGQKTSAQTETENLTKYYTDLPMTWGGLAAKSIGLTPGEVVTKEQFSLLLENINPVTKKQLTARTVEGRRLYFDATLSAPKSVSILAVTMGDSRLIKAHEEASRVALNYLEKYSQTRVRVKGQNTVRVTGNCLRASVTHATSRANDPQIHSHNLIFNVTWDGEENKFKALEAFEIYNNVGFFTEVYRNAMAEKVKAIGYEIERAKHGWEIKGVTHEINTLFSKRSASIKEAEKHLEKLKCRPITNRERALLTERTRAAKSKSLSLKDAVKYQKEELTREQLRELESVMIMARNNEKKLTRMIEIFGPKKEGVTKAENEAITFSTEHIFERQSVAKKNEILSLALKHSYGDLRLENLEKSLETTAGLIKDEDTKSYGTIEGLAREKFICEFVESSKNKFENLFESLAKTVDETLSEDLKNHDQKVEIISEKVETNLRPDQATALNEILSSTDQVTALLGGAGSGKSHLLLALKNKIKLRGKAVIATAPTSGATQNLTKDIGVSAFTIQKILHNPKIYESELTNGYLIVDEAGLLSLKQMEALFHLSKVYSTQILLVGDTGQHHGIEAGDALRVLRLYTDIKTASLTGVERQQVPEYKEAIRDLLKRDVKNAWEKFEAMGVIHSKDDYLNSLGKNIQTDDLEKKLDTNKLYQTYLEKLQNKKSVLVVTPTRVEAEVLTNGIRSSLKENHLKSTSLIKEVFASQSFTEAEKMSVSSYIAYGEAPHHIHVLESSGAFKKGSF